MSEQPIYLFKKGELPADAMAEAFSAWAAKVRDGWAQQQG